MSKNTINVTSSYQQIASGAVVITVKTAGKGVLLFDENQNDSTAYRSSAPVGEQFSQSQTVPTFIRATGDGWVVIVDGVL